MSESFHEQVAELRRKQILQAAVAVFAERGFHRTAIRDIARAAGVADGTIYNYFENKLALLLAIIDPLNEREQSVLPPPALAPTDLRAFFRQYFAQRLVFGDDALKALRVVLSEVLVNAELRAVFVERVIAPAITLGEPVLEHLMAAGLIRPLDTRLTLRSIVATFQGLVVLRLLDDGPLGEQWDDLPDLLTDLLLNGLLPRD